MLNVLQEQNLLKVTVYGDSGTGKTYLGCTAPKPVILLAERQGFATVRRASHDLGIPTPPTFHVASMDAMRTAAKILARVEDEPLAELVRSMPIDEDGRKLSGKALDAALKSLPYLKPETVVCDSFTEFADVIAQDIIKSTPTLVGSDGLPVLPERYWNTLYDRFVRMAKSFRDLPYHVLILALLDDRQKTQANEKRWAFGGFERWVGPDLPMRKMPRLVKSTVNAVGWLREEPKASEEGGDQTERVVRFGGPEWVTHKEFPPLERREVANFTEWVRKINEFQK